MISKEQHFGLSKYLTISVDTNLHFGRFRVWNVAAIGSGLSLILPDYENIPLGGPVFYIINSGNESIDINDQDDSLIKTLAADESCKLVLTVDDEGNKVWFAL